MELTFNKNSYNITELQLYLPINGCWDIPYLRVADELAISVGQAVEVKIFDKVLKGTAIDVSIYGGVTTLIIAASTYKLKDVYPANHIYGGVINDVVKIILGNTGMVLSPNSDKSILNTSFNAFHSIQAPAGDTLNNLLKLSKGAIWKIELDGTLFVGKISYSDISVKYPSAIENDNYIVREKYMDKYDVFTMEFLFEPGFTIDNKKVLATELDIEADSSGGSSSQKDVIVTTLFHFQEPVEDSISEIGSNENQLLYLKKYSASVVEQPSDTTVSIYLDSDVQELFEGGLKNVPIIVPMPNTVIKVKPGAKCILEFIGGSPVNPAITGWYHGQDDLVSVTFSDNIKPPGGFIDVASRKGDRISVGTLTGSTAAGPVTFVYTPYDTSQPQITNATIPLSGGLITSGSTKITMG